MVKKYYEILEVSENATSEEIKKSYRKLALKWHPDKWMSKSPEEKETANKKIQEINKAYEVLGNEELKRRYDNGEEFTSDFGGYDYEGEIREEARRREEELRKARVDIIDIELEILKLEMKSLDRSSTLNEIRMAFYLTYPRVFEENLDSKLWEGYQDWGEKVVKMEINIPKGKERSEELKQFREEMSRAIKEAETVLINKEKDKENQKKQRAGSRVEREIASSIEEIERLMSEKGLQAQDLGEYSNYKEKINGLDKIWKIRDLRDRVIEVVNSQRAKSSGSNDKRRGKEQGREQKGENFGNRPTNQNKRDGKGEEGQIPGKSDDNSNSNDNNQKPNYNKLTREELINTVNQKDFEISTLKEIIQALERKISELEEEIAELKSEPQTSQIQQEIHKRENYLREARSSLAKINALNDGNPAGDTGNNKSDNNFPIGWVIGGIILALALLISIVWSKKRKK